MVPVGCISRSPGQKLGFQNAIFKNLHVLNYNAQSFHILYIASSRGPLLKLFKLCPLGQNWPRPGGHNFTLNYIRESSNYIFSWTANGNLTKLNRNGPWVVSYQNCSNGSDWLHMLVTVNVAEEMDAHDGTCRYFFEDFPSYLTRKYNGWPRNVFLQTWIYRKVDCYNRKQSVC